MSIRQARALAMIDISRSSGLEIGPLDRPLVTKDMGRIAYVDHATRADIASKYAGDPAVEPSRIVEIDYVHSDLPLIEAVQGVTFDYVIASHVIEHVADMVGWLREVGDVLRVGGVLSLIVPDKRYTFDFLRPLSGPGEIVDAYVARHQRPTFRQVFESLAMSVELSLEEAWSGVLDPQALAFRHTEDVALGLAKSALEGEYVDVHSWVFTPQSFFEIIRFLIQIDLFDFRVVDFITTPPGELEFYVTLEKLDRETEPEVRAARQLDSIPLNQSDRRSDRVLGSRLVGLEDHNTVRPDERLAKPERAQENSDSENESAILRWASQHTWSDRVRLALPHRWGLLSRAMRGRW